MLRPEATVMHVVLYGGSKSALASVLNRNISKSCEVQFKNPISVSWSFQQSVVYLAKLLCEWLQFCYGFVGSLITTFFFCLFFFYFSASSCTFCLQLYLKMPRWSVSKPSPFGRTPTGFGNELSANCFLPALLMLPASFFWDIHARMMSVSLDPPWGPVSPRPPPKLVEVPPGGGIFIAVVQEVLGTPEAAWSRLGDSVLSTRDPYLSSLETP